MGCTQASNNVISPTNHIPIERLYGNDDYSVAQAIPSPVITITAPPTPAYVKSALKKPREPKSVFNRPLPSLNRVVNFDEQVLVKARTPTPDKVWYQKASSTMPMRKRPRNDDDDYDYDDEEEEVSSDEQVEDENNASPMVTVRPPTPLRRRSQPDSLWHQNDPTGSTPSANISNEDDPFSTAPQSSSNISTPANRIKVRRRLPELTPPLIAPVPSYQPNPLQSSTSLPYLSSAPRPTLSPYPVTTQPTIASPYQSPLRLSPPAFHVQRIVPPTNTALPAVRLPLVNTQSLPQTAYYAVNHPPNGHIT